MGKGLECGNVTYRISHLNKSHVGKADNQFQEFIKRTGGSLNQSQASKNRRITESITGKRKDLMSGVIT